MTNSLETLIKNKLMYMPSLASKHGADVDNFILYVHAIMGMLFVGWLAFFLYTLWRFRKSRQPKADYVGVTSHASSYAEVGVAVVEGLLLIFFAIPLWAKSVDQFPDPEKSTVMRIIGKQFNWIARYPGTNGVFGANRLELVTTENPMGIDPSDPQGKDDVLTGIDEMAVPVNKPVIAHITSLDVIHSFKLVPLRVTQDANPGMSIPIHFIPTVTNTYLIQCSQLCGNGHYNMKGMFKVLSQGDYDAWIKKKSSAANTPVNYE